MILEEPDAPRTLLIKRAERDGDPWSGQVAFPGGKMDAKDRSVLDAAIRETREEVGVDLREDAKLLGFFGSFRTHTGTMDVVPVVFQMKHRVDLKLNQEVSSCVWVTLGSLQEPSARSTYRFASGNLKSDLPAIKVGHYVIWGLTLRMIEALFELVRT